MDMDPLDVSELIHTVWEFRQAALQFGESAGTKFMCPNCEQMKPFAGDNALEYYNNSCGIALVCNDCLLEFNARRGVERVGAQAVDRVGGQHREVPGLQGSHGGFQVGGFGVTHRHRSV
jgi:hypothetical protein